MTRRPGKSPIRLWAVVFWLLVWQAAAMAMAAAYPNGGGLLLASPVTAGRRLLSLLPTAGFWQTVAVSAGRILGGFLAACLLGIGLGALAFRHRRIRELLSPPVAAVKAVPVVSFIILALVWVDGPALPWLIAGLMVFPPVYLNVLEGAGQADRKLLEMARVFRMSRRRQLRAIYLPAALPHFRAAVSLGLGLCWKSGVAAEVIGLLDGTIGERLYAAKVYFQTGDLFAWTAVIVALAAVAEKLALWGLDALGRKVGC